MTEQSKAKPKGLGRGLSALLEDDKADLAALDRMRGGREVPIEQIRPNPDQPRRHFGEAELSELATSIAEHGVLAPILVRRSKDNPDKYEIIAGERRWRAAQMARLHSLPVVVKDVDDNIALQIAIIENVQRQDLSPLEEAEAYQKLMEAGNLSQSQAAQQVGKSRSHLANMVRLLTLPGEVRGMLDSGAITAGHARALVVAEDPVALAREIKDQGLNVRAAEKLAKKRSRGLKEPGGNVTSLSPAPNRKDANVREVERQLSDRLGLRVEIDNEGGKGQIRIWYSSLEQFDDILRRLKTTPK